MLDGGGETGSEPLSLRERHKIVQEEAIIAAAHALMMEKGYEATTMDDIAARASISKPTLYARFPNKEAIAVRAVVALQKEGLAFMRSLSAEMPPAEKLRSIIERIFVRKYVLRLAAFGSARVVVMPQIRAHPEYQKHAAEIVAILAEIIEAGQREGAFSAERHPRIAAQTMVSFLRDSEMDDLITSGMVPAEAAVRTMTDIILCGIENR